MVFAIFLVVKGTDGPVIYFIIDKETGWAGGGEKSAFEGSHLKAGGGIIILTHIFKMY